MASIAEWVEGARLRTLPAAIAPVLAGTTVALLAGEARWGRVALALLVALALQVGVNYANDYSDGIRGTDAERVGPARLVGGGLAAPATVKFAAFACFGVACIAGLVLTVLTQAWWLILVGIACIVAAWYYTGGEHPYGYAGLGELFVFLFFGLVAVAGTAFVQMGEVPAAAWWAAVAIGMMACAILVANNLRDIDGDRLVGKRTLSTRVGDRGSRVAYALMVVIATVSLVVMAAVTTWWLLLGLVFLGALAPAVGPMVSGATGRPLITVLKVTGLAELALAAGMFCGALIQVGA